MQKTDTVVAVDTAPVRAIAAPCDPFAPGPRTTTAADLDRLLHACQGRFPGGQSAGLASLAFLDWAAHALNGPFRMGELGREAIAHWQRLARIALGAEAMLPLPQGDNRFSNPAWADHPNTLVVQAVLLGEQWCDSVVQGPHGTDLGSRRIVNFNTRRFLDAISPANWPGFVAKATCGAASPPPEPLHFRLGLAVAPPPERVPRRQAPLAPIQYEPTTATVAMAPASIVLAGRMKY